jgi:hypothetical protein
MRFVLFQEGVFRGGVALRNTASFLRLPLFVFLSSFQKLFF